MIAGIDTDTPEPEAGRIGSEDQIRVEVAKVLADFRDGVCDGDDALDRIIEVTGWTPDDGVDRE